MKITDISIKRTTIPVVLFVIFGLAGLFSYFQLNKELTPKMDIPVNVIMTIYPGAAPSEVESSVTKKIEEAISAIEGIDKITANSYESVSLIQIQYKDGIDADKSLQECERKVNAIKENLPANCKDSRFMKYGIDMFPIMSIAVNANIPDKEFYDIVDKDIKTKLQQIKGIANVDILGGNQREIEIKVNAQKLDLYGISMLQLQQVIAASNLDFPTGKIKNDDSKYIVRVAGKFENLDQIKNLVVGANREGSVIKMEDIASVVDGTKKTSKLARINGKNAIGISILKQTDGNAVEVSKEVRKILAESKKQYAAQELNFTIASDTSEFTEEAVSGVMKDLIFAIILVSITMLLFLHTFRNLIFILISIPTSVISTFLFFGLFGFSLNLLTLLALSIVIGAIVDDAIVVLENIYRHMEMGKTRWQASIDACKEIGLTVTSITLVLIAVFLPIGLTTGITGQLLRAFSLTIVISILLSLLVSFTLVPMLTSRFGKLKVFNKKNVFDRFLLRVEHVINWLRMSILSGLKMTLANKTVTILVSTVLLFASFYLVGGGFVQTEFMDAGDRGEFNLTMELDRTSTLEQTNAKCLEIEKKLLQYPEIKNIYTKVGTRTGNVTVLETPYAAEFLLKLVPKNERKLSSKLFAIKLKNELIANFAGPSFKPQSMNIAGSTQQPINIYVRANSLDSAIKYSRIVANELKSISGTTDVQSSVEAGDKEFVVKFDREKLAKLGLTIGEIGAQMNLAYEGNRDLKYRDGSNEYDIFIALDEFDRQNKSDLENISFTNRAGQLIKLSQVALISESESPSTLTRFNKKQSVSITGNLVGKTIGTVGKEIKERIAKAHLPNDVDVFYSGDMEQQSKSFGSMLVALLASIIFMYLIMVALYDSYVYPLVVMLSLPLALIGAFLALALAGKSLSLFSIMGIIMLMGLVAKNAILVVDFANKLQQEGKKVMVAITEATSVRFRPILMTNLALIVGLLPIALASGAGAEWKGGLGWVLIGGLSSSMALSFLVVPVLYVILDKLVKKSKKEEPVKYMEKFEMDEIAAPILNN
jgi:hydrophobic/amphiphilic exporter-1 (mainly G- bacteria), HAE1 family